MSNEIKSEPLQTAIERLATEDSPGFLGELWDFMRHSKKWWLTPILLAILLIGALVLVSGTAWAPFIYTFF